MLARLTNHFKCVLTGSLAPQAISQSEFEARRAAVDAFNTSSRYRKRGLAAVPSKFGVAFTLLTMCQVCSSPTVLENIYQQMHGVYNVLCCRSSIDLPSPVHCCQLRVSALSESAILDLRLPRSDLRAASSLAL